MIILNKNHYSQILKSTASLKAEFSLNWYGRVKVNVRFFSFFGLDYINSNHARILKY